MTKPTDPPDRKEDHELHQLYVELDALDTAIRDSLFREGSDALKRYRSKVLGWIKERERRHAKRD